MIVTLEQAKDRLNITTDRDDVELMLFIEAIAAPIEKHLNEIVEPREVEEDLDLSGWRRFWLASTPVISLTSLERVDGTVTYDVTKLRVGTDGRVRVKTGPVPVGPCIAVYQAGRTVIPPNYREGALVILQHVWETQRGVGGTKSGVIGAEEIRKTLSAFTVPGKAHEWLGEPTIMVR